MLFFSKKKPALPPKVDVPTTPKTIEYRALRGQYEALCNEKNGHINVDKLGDDFDKLMSHPYISMLAINLARKELLIGSKAVILTDKDGCRRYIGEFIVTFFLMKNTVSFENITGARLVECQGQTYTFHHPHINAGGKMCLQEENQAHIAISYGDLRLASEIYLAALFSYGPGAAYRDLKHWPVYEKEKHDARH